MSETLIIDRTLWLRGEGSGDSYLLRERDGKMCCLGFYCVAHGLSTEDIADKSTPAYIPHLTIEDAERFGLKPLVQDVEYDSDLCNNLTMTNDNEWLSNPNRERLIIKYFAWMGVVVEFIN